MTQFQHILVPVDFGVVMQPGVELAVALAQKLDARVTLVNAFDISQFASMTTPFAPTVDVEALLADAEKELSHVLARVRADWPKTDAVLYRATPEEAILAVAASHGCDLIVIGTHGRTGVAHMLLGSVAEAVVRRSPVAVLTVHPPPARP
jgi:universal stress protein A